MHLLRSRCHGNGVFAWQQAQGGIAEDEKGRGEEEDLGGLVKRELGGGKEGKIVATLARVVLSDVNKRSSDTCSQEIKIPIP